MLTRLTLCSALFLATALPLRAQGTLDLGRALRLDEVMAVMREEGVSYGNDLEGELFPGAGGARWQGMVADIYDTAGMRERFDTVFDAEMADDPEAVAMASDFFASDRGQRIVSLEIEARRALLDDAVEEAAQQHVEEMRRKQDPRLEMITRFAEANDLIELNVAGALNANLAFYRGLSSGGALDQQMSESDMLSDVWSQEEQIRGETQDWIYPFLTMAYQPLSDDDLAAYIAFSETEPGQKVNAAMFAGFDAVFGVISEHLGAAAAQMLAGQDI